MTQRTRIRQRAHISEGSPTMEYNTNYRGILVDTTTCWRTLAGAFAQSGIGEEERQRMELMQLICS